MREIPTLTGGKVQAPKEPAVLIYRDEDKPEARPCLEPLPRPAKEALNAILARVPTLVHLAERAGFTIGPFILSAAHIEMRINPDSQPRLVRLRSSHPAQVHLESRTTPWGSEAFCVYQGESEQAIIEVLAPLEPAMRTAMGLLAWLSPEWKGVLGDFEAALSRLERRLPEGALAGDGTVIAAAHLPEEMDQPSGILVETGFGIAAQRAAGRIELRMKQLPAAAEYPRYAPRIIGELAERLSHTSTQDPQHPSRAIAKALAEELSHNLDESPVDSLTWREFTNEFWHPDALRSLTWDRGGPPVARFRLDDDPLLWADDLSGTIRKALEVARVLFANEQARRLQELVLPGGAPVEHYVPDTGVHLKPSPFGGWSLRLGNVRYRWNPKRSGITIQGLGGPDDRALALLGLAGAGVS